MAEKSFGVKEINLIGASGTPTIESPNNLNLKAVNVAISTNVSIGGTLSVTGNVSVGGTLTYEDVTNVDVVGVATFGDKVLLGDSGVLGLGDAGLNGGTPDLRFFHNGNTSNIINTTGGFHISQNHSDGLFLRADTLVLRDSNNNDMIRCTSSDVTINPNSGGVTLKHNGNQTKLETTTTGVDITGAVTATSIVKSGGTSSQYLMADGSTTTSGGGGGGGSGISTISGVVNIANDLDVDGHTNLDNVSIAGVTTFSDAIWAGRIYFGGSNGKYMQAGSNFELAMGGGVDIILTANNSGGTSGDIRLRRGSGTDSLVVNGSGGVTVTGTLSATTFSGSGSNLTNLPAGQLSGNLPSISGANLTNLPSPSPTNSDIQGMWTIGGNASGYTFTGPGQDGSEQNPDIFLVRGQRYRFVNSTGNGHPFEFRNFDNNADYTDGITGPQNGTQDFNVQHDAPSALKYRCTIHTNSMLGNIYIIGGKRGILTSNTTLSGSSQSFDGIPSWATKIKIIFYRLSMSANGETYVKLRNGNGDISSGYDSYSVSDDGSNEEQLTSAFVMMTTSNAHRYSGEMVIEKVGDTRYVSTSSFVRSSTAFSGAFQHITGGGDLEINSGGIVTGIKLLTSTGNFDSSPSTNYISIYYE